MDTVAGFVLEDLGETFNNTAISRAGHTDVAGLNIWRNSYPAEEMPAGGELVTVGGVPFRFPASGENRHDNVICLGQMLKLSPGLYDWIYVLAASERRTEDWVYLHFADGAVDPEWLRVSDFWPAAAHFGEVEAFRCRRLHYPRHVQEGVHVGMWRQRVAVPREQELVGLRLPDNLAIHLFAMTLVPAALRQPERAKVSR